MSEKRKLVVKVTADYYDIIECTDQLLCAQIIGMIADRERTHPQTAEEILRDGLEEERDEAKSLAQTKQWRIDTLEKKLKDLEEKIAGLTEEKK